MELVENKKYFDKAAHRYVWYVGKRKTWFGRPIEEYVFVDVCDETVTHEVGKFDIDKWLEEV